jgi:hypothetical protein
MARGKSRLRKGGKPQNARSSSAAPLPVLPPEEEGEAPPVAMLRDEDLHVIFLRLDHPADLVRAALACRRWRLGAARVAALSRAPPFLRYFFHPSANFGPPPFPSNDPIHRPAVFAPLDLYSPPLPQARARRRQRPVHQRRAPRPRPRPPPPGRGRPKATSLPRILAVDPSSCRRELLPPPPSTALRGDAWRNERRVLGVAVLSRARSGSRLTFEAVCVTLDGDRPRAWVANVRDGDYTWRLLPRSKDVKVDFEPEGFDRTCVHAAGNIYWHVADEDRLLALDPRTLKFSFLLVMDDVGDHYHVGETPEDGNLCIVTTAEDQGMQIWVRGEDDESSNNGWVLQREVCMREALDSVPRLPHGRLRMNLVWVTDMDYARTGKVFINTWGFGRYAFHLETG